MTEKMTLTLGEIARAVNAAEENGQLMEELITLIKKHESGIGYIFEIEFETGPKTKTVVEITGVEDW